MKVTQTKVLFVTITVAMIATGCVAEDEASTSFDTNANALESLPGLPDIVVGEQPGNGVVRTTTMQRRNAIANVNPAEEIVTVTAPDLTGHKALANVEKDPETALPGSYLFESVEIRDGKGSRHYDSNAPGETWIGSLKLDNNDTYKLVAQRVAGGSGTEEMVKFEGNYKIRNRSIDFVDYDGAIQFRMDYTVFSTDDLIFLTHSAKYGEAKDGDIVGIVAKRY